ncbi:hypothetical protein EJ03DRAFT_329887 [Teratosphaeria nubilosa]|uniref:Uncharacterized protein n=1 Tax=Teratosphaeria nubilosa TaxID=161662 RepID=A0A6G1L310_9PEZI|nr:hypothetical protein EJ03DRAFT_329887 [Teratosphaeria nubilosa]
MFCRSNLLAALALLATNAFSVPIVDLSRTCTPDSVNGEVCDFINPDLTLSDGYCEEGQCKQKSTTWVIPQPPKTCDAFSPDGQDCDYIDEHFELTDGFCQTGVCKPRTTTWELPKNPPK